ncbi:MAG TPA: hypothetical protein VFN42_06505 [Acetobacteraceae bacterium]|nr:hypothetical protein [Acetobacteraceae bacterium]
MRLLLALGVAAAFAATAPLGFARTSNTGQTSSNTGSPTYSSPGYHEGGASAQPKQYQRAQAGQSGVYSSPGYHQGGASAQPNQYKRAQAGQTGNAPSAKK